MNNNDEGVDELSPITETSSRTPASESIDGASCIAGRVAVVTGASSGIGRAIALALARQSVRLCLVGRDPIALSSSAAQVRQFTQVNEFQVDLSVEAEIQRLRRQLEGHADQVDILIHSAGIIYQDLMGRAHIEHLDAQYATNVRAPYLVTQQLLPLLTTSCGQIVFINSSAGLSAKRPEVGQYSATKHALKAIADSLREEVNPKGIRVLTIYVGRTATPMQESLYRQEGRAYHPERLLQPDDVASAVVHALMIPRTAEITDMSIRPMYKEH